MNQIYLDYNSTTPIDPRVADAMRPHIEEYFGNPSSSHLHGAKARLAVETARRQVAQLIGCKPQEIVFTSGGTESNNLALKGAANALRSKGNHIIISAVEHPAVTEVTNFLASQGFSVSIAPVDQLGMVDPESIAGLIRTDTILISVMHANNETGTIQPVASISEIAKKHGVLMHTDAAQSLGKIAVKVNELNIDLLSIAGHKLYAPKGIGALYIRHGVKIEKLIHGADHEQNLRAGTENVLEIVGLGKACEIAGAELLQYQSHTRNLKNQFIAGLEKRLGKLHINGHRENCLPNTVSVGFRKLNAQTILAAMPEIAASAGAACHTGDTGESSVLGAMKVSPEFSQGTIRFSVGRFTTASEIESAIKIISQSILSLQPENQSVDLEYNSDSKIKLTQFTHGMGCACKIRPADLEKILAGLPPVTDPKVLVGTADRDDAAVYQLSADLALVQTVDFFTPVVDDPYTFGAIAAANSLSDIYAMGAKPIFALNIAAFPVNRLPLSVLQEIIKGATDKAAEAGISILGGHSIEDTEPKFGMVISGLVHPDKVLRNDGAKPGDMLILTKPIGNGIIATANKMGLASEQVVEKSGKWMATLNAVAANEMNAVIVNACTDITGFGLMGHLHEVTLASGVDAELDFNKIPFMGGVEELAMAGAIPGGSIANYENAVEWSNFGALSTNERYMICDAQTSGGLLVCLPPEEAVKFQILLENKGVFSAAIGKLTRPGTGFITVNYRN
ncbi:MAG: selenide, water dikinase SelD [Lentimicrobium sp.]|nr:selenide, water dikinase SelD [Lentimicrobium sp.]